jgi:hypothetical protein
VGDLPAFGTVGEWQGRGRITAWERRGMCELAFTAAGERHGMCKSCLILSRILIHQNSVDTVTERADLKLPPIGMHA